MALQPLNSVLGLVQARWYAVLCLGCWLLLTQRFTKRMERTAGARAMQGPGGGRKQQARVLSPTSRLVPITYGAEKWRVPDDPLTCVRQMPRNLELTPWLVIKKCVGVGVSLCLLDRLCTVDT